MLAKCIKDVVCTRETQNSFTCGNTYKIEEDLGEYFAINDMNQKHWISSGEEDVGFFKEYFKIIEFETTVTFGGSLPRPKIIGASVLERALEVTELIDRFTYEELNSTMNEIREGETPNKVYIKMLDNIRIYWKMLQDMRS